jgi:uncharacterized membrane protein
MLLEGLTTIGVAALWIVALIVAVVLLALSAPLLKAGGAYPLAFFGLMGLTAYGLNRLKCLLID